MRPRVFITPREPFATSPPYRAPSAPQELPFLVGFQHAGRKIRQDFAFEDCQGDEAFWSVVSTSTVTRRSPTLMSLLLRLSFSTQTASFQRTRSPTMNF